MASATLDCFPFRKLRESDKAQRLKEKRVKEALQPM